MKLDKSTKGKKTSSHSINSSKIFEVRTTDIFIKEATTLRKKYPHIKENFKELLKQLKSDPFTGNDFIGKNIYKVRMPLSDKQSGQRGGARVIIEVLVLDRIVYVLSVFDKSIKENLLDTELKKIINQPRTRENRKSKQK
ncbi:MAG: hypothetical protein ACR2KB_10645 [Chitinophagaceae bacterium]